MDTPDPPEKVREGEGRYRELVDMMMLFCFECERYEERDWPKEKGDPKVAP